MFQFWPLIFLIFLIPLYYVVRTGSNSISIESSYQYWVRAKGINFARTLNICQDVLKRANLHYQIFVDSHTSSTVHGNSNCPTKTIQKNIEANKSILQNMSPDFWCMVQKCWTNVFKDKKFFYIALFCKVKQSKIATSKTNKIKKQTALFYLSLAE